MSLYDSIQKAYEKVSEEVGVCVSVQPNEIKKVEHLIDACDFESSAVIEEFVSESDPNDCLTILRIKGVDEIERFMREWVITTNMEETSAYMVKTEIMETLDFWPSLVDFIFAHLNSYAEVNARLNSQKLETVYDCSDSCKVLVSADQFYKALKILESRGYLEEVKPDVFDILKMVELRAENVASVSVPSKKSRDENLLTLWEATYDFFTDRVITNRINFTHEDFEEWLDQHDMKINPSFGFLGELSSLGILNSLSASSYCISNEFIEGLKESIG